MTLTHETVRQTMVSYSAPGDNDAFVCVTPWANGEGFDADVNETGCVHQFQLTWTQWDALKKAIKANHKANHKAV